jgi:hypothetical protein
MISETQATPSEFPGVTVRVQKRHRMLLLVAALIGAFLTYAFIQTSLSSSTVFGTALSGFLALCFAAVVVLNVIIGLSGFLPNFLRVRLTTRWRADALKRAAQRER